MQSCDQSLVALAFAWETLSYASVAKGLKLKVIPTFVEVTLEKLVGGGINILSYSVYLLQR